MAITEESRHHLYQRLEEVLGPEEASTLMQHLPPIGWADVATKHDLDQLATVLTLRMDNTDLRTEHRFDAIDQRFDSMEQRFDHRFVAMEQRFDERFAAMDQRFDAMERRFDEQFVAMDQRFDSIERRFDERLTATERRSDDRIDAAVARFEDRLASGLAGVELTMITAFGDFRDQLHAEQRTLQRQVILLLLTTLVTISVASIGLR